MAGLKIKEAYMKIITRYRLFNRFRLVILGILFLSMILTYLLQSGVFKLLFFFNTEAPDIAGRVEEVRSFLIHQVLTMDRWVTSAFSVLIVLLPVLACASVYLFIKEKRGMFCYRFARKQPYNTVVLSSVLVSTFICSVSFYLVYFLYCLVGFFVTEQEVAIDRPVLDFIFGAAFSQDNPFLFFVIGGFVSVFLLSFVYSLLACSLALVMRKTYQAIMIPILYFFGMSQLFAVLSTAIHPMLIVLQPIFTLNFFAYGNAVPIWEFLVSLVPPLLISAGIIIYVVNRKECDEI